MKNGSIIAVLMLLMSVGLLAHVELRPQMSTPGAEQLYTVRAHNEAKVAIASVELDVPADITVSDVPAPAVGTFDVKREGGRVVAITWTRDIKPATFADFKFTARNPATGSQIAWHVREKLADGTVNEWGGTTKGAHPAPITKLMAGMGKSTAEPAGHDEHKH